jgi:hypothetical protein
LISDSNYSAQTRTALSGYRETVIEQENRHRKIEESCKGIAIPVLVIHATNTSKIEVQATEFLVCPKTDFDESVKRDGMGPECLRVSDDSAIGPLATRDYGVSWVGYEPATHQEIELLRVKQGVARIWTNVEIEVDDSITQLFGCRSLTLEEEEGLYSNSSISEPHDSYLLCG